MPVLKDPRENVVFIKAKEALICRSIFPKSFKSLKLEPVILLGIAHKRETEIKVKVADALIFQSATKAPGLDKINFQILHMI